jgi:hypothetical protein
MKGTNIFKFNLNLIHLYNVCIIDIAVKQKFGVKYLVACGIGPFSPDPDKDSEPAPIPTGTKSLLVHRTGNVTNVSHHSWKIVHEETGKTYIKFIGLEADKIFCHRKIISSAKY